MMRVISEDFMGLALIVASRAELLREASLYIYIYIYIGGGGQTCKMVWSFPFYSLLFSFRLFELRQ